MVMRMVKYSRCSVFREQFGNFLNRLETSHHVSQTAITEITKELLAVTNSMHSQTIKKVAQSLGM
jgi:gamma-glutamyl-gamma-aminobutyrate hydrolase PuuD